MRINLQKETKSNFQLQRASQLQKVLNDVFTRSSFTFKDKQVFVNVIYVDFSKDLMNAKVLVDTFGLDEESKDELINKLNKDFIKQIRGIVCQKLKVKYTPQIVFICEHENKKEKEVLKILEEGNN